MHRHYAIRDANPVEKRIVLQAQLAKALKEREQLRARLDKLDESAEDNDVSGEKSVEFKTEYNQQLQAVEREITSLKNRCRNEINTLKTTVDAYNAQIDKLRAAAANGELDPGEFQRQVSKLSRGKQQALETLAAYEAMLGAESAVELAGITLPQGATAEVGDIPNLAMRVAAVLVGALILISVFVPAVSSPTGTAAKVSLFRAGTGLLNRGYRAGLLIWLVPIVLAVAVGLTSAIPKRAVRGSVLLCVGTLVLALLVVSLSVATFYPMPAAEGLAAIANAVASPGTGVLSMFVALLGVYVLGGVNLWVSAAGKGLTMLTALLLVLAGLGTSGYCLFGVNADPELVLAVGEQRWDAVDMTITLSNKGNLPMFLRDELSEDARRNEFTLKMQRREADGGWTDTTVGIGSGVVGTDDGSVAPGQRETVAYEAGLADYGYDAVVRAVLVNNRGHAVTSDPVEIGRSSQLAPFLVPGPTPGGQQDGAATLAQRWVDALEAQGTTVPLARLADSVADVQRAINKVEDEAVRDTLHRRVDRLILNAKDAQTADMYATAYERYENKLYNQAIEACNRIIEVCSTAPTPAVLQQEPNTLQQARVLLAHIEMLVDPVKRYEIRGIMMQGDIAFAMLYDNHTQATLSVQEKDKLDEYRIETIDAVQTAVVLRKGGETYTLRRR